MLSNVSRRIYLQNRTCPWSNSLFFIYVGLAYLAITSNLYKTF